MPANIDRILDKIRVVLIETSHPGNIGSTCRAMRVMGLGQLVLVRPRYYPHPKIEELASGADEHIVVEVVSSLEEAARDCVLVVGTSARTRHLSGDVLSVKEATDVILPLARRGQSVAIVFGPERTGLVNEDLALCHHQICIDTNSSYASLNLAAAVQIICYELRQGLVNIDDALPMTSDVLYADQKSCEALFMHVKQILVALGFFKEDNPGRLIPRLRRLLNRSRLEVMEVNIIRGILSSIDKQLKLKKTS